MNICHYSFSPESIHDPVFILRRNQNSKNMPVSFRTFSDPEELKPLNTVQFFDIILCNLFSSGTHPVSFLQLRNPKSSQNIRLHIRVARINIFIEPSGTIIRQKRVLVSAFLSHDLDTCSNLIIVSDHGSAFSGCQVLCSVKAECRDIRKRTGFLSLINRSYRLCSVMNLSLIHISEPTRRTPI